VRSVLGSSRQEGRLIDVSFGGAAVALDSRPGGSQVEVGLWADGYGARLLCDVVSSNTGPSGETLLHLRFREPSAPQQAFIRQLVALLIETSAEAS
jgi:hypothetical protein